MTLPGTKFSEEHKARIGLSRLGEKNPMWKGNGVGYSSLHQWVRLRLPEPKACQCCNKQVPLDLTNISGKYLRDLSDWEYLCRRCHMASDGRLKIFATARIRYWKELLKDKEKYVAWIAKQKIASTGKKRSQETRQKMSLARKNYFIRLKKEKYKIEQKDV